ncbi:MAG: carboxypeptidase M32 [Planctomycetota bacterium]
MQTIETLLELLGEVQDLTAASALLEWDQETYMPPKAAAARAQQLASLAGIAHEKLTSPEIGALLGRLREARGLSEDEQALVRETARDHDRARKLPRELVQALARAQSEALHVWTEAKQASRFEPFAPHLERLIALKQEVARHLGFAEVPYDALIDDHELGATTRSVAALFAKLAPELVSLLRAIQASPVPIDARCVQASFAEDAQIEFALDVARAMGFDLEAGRLDRSAHPFCTAFHPTDVRLTTRFGEHDLRPALFGVIHEAGHGLYEQGLDVAWSRTPLGHPASLGIHESQSRLWENIVARSLPFWRHFFPKLKAKFAAQLEPVTLEQFYRAINQVRPSLIRVEADEVTYNLHIILRFELEQQLFAGTLQVRDLPSAWNRRMQQWLGVEPPSDKEGVLQDIHWAMGAFGYFPTYTLGNVYAAQLFERAQQDLAGLEQGIARGELTPLRDWLRERVHRQGRRYPPAQLIERATGQAPSHEPFVRYLRAKFGAIYRL